MTIKPTRVHAFNHADALGHHDAVALAGQLQRGETSATALVQAAYQRLELVNPELHATACLQEEAALAQARFYDDVGNFRAFQGIPGFLKDNLDLQGLPTRHGSAAMPDTARKHTSAVAHSRLSTQAWCCWVKQSCPSSGLQPPPSTAKPSQHTTHGTLGTAQGVLRAVRLLWWQRVWFQLPMQTTAVAQFAFPLHVAGWWVETQPRAFGHE